jgi:transposase-like protein
MTKRRSTPAYPAELRERGVRLFRENRADYASDTAAYRAIAPKLGCSPDSLRSWCQQAERDAGQRAGLTSAEKDRIKELERENRELRTANEILKKASAYFAAAELVLWDSRLLMQKGAAAQHRKLRGSGGGGVVRSLVFQDRGRV